MNKKDVEKFVSYCKGHLDFEIESPAGYCSAPLSALDAIFSLGIRYKTVVNVLNRFCNKFQLKWQTTDIKTSVMLSNIERVMQDEKISIEEFANLYLNNNKTSTSQKPDVAILKADAFVQALKIMKKHNIETCSDVLAKAKVDDSTFEADFLSIKGQRPGTSLHYLYMLCGDEEFIKVDRHIKNFTCQALNEENLDHDKIVTLFKEAVMVLKTDNKDITPKRLDHIIWKFMSNKKGMKNQGVANNVRMPIDKKRKIRKKWGQNVILEGEWIEKNSILLFVGQKPNTKTKIGNYFCELNFMKKSDKDISVIAKPIFDKFGLPLYSWKSDNHQYKYVEFDNDEKSLVEANALMKSILDYVKTCQIN